MKKVLFIGTTNIYGGVGHIMFELCKNINREEFQIDFLYYEDASPEARELIRSLGGEFYLVPRYSKNPVRFYKEIKKFYDTHSYDIVHVHASSAMLIMYALPVWKDEKVRIVYQSHIDTIKGVSNQILHGFFQYFVKKYVDCCIAVSQIAAEFMYGSTGAKDSVILRNGIEIKHFLFDKEMRMEIRKKLSIESKYVIGHIGRFSAQKNHLFLIDVFKDIHTQNPDTVLLLIGNGEDEQKIREKVAECQLTESVIFYGTSNDVPKLLCAMDCFVFPSAWEGLGIVAIEAQANGLPVIASTQVPEEAKVTDLFEYRNLDDAISEWSSIILEKNITPDNRKKYNAIVAESGYDIGQVAKELENIYLNC